MICDPAGQPFITNLPLPQLAQTHAHSHVQVHSCTPGERFRLAHKILPPNPCVKGGRAGPATLTRLPQQVPRRHTRHGRPLTSCYSSSFSLLLPASPSTIRRVSTSSLDSSTTTSPQHSSIQQVNVLPAVADCFVTTSRVGGGKGVTIATVQAAGGRVIGVLLVV